MIKKDVNTIQLVVFAAPLLLYAYPGLAIFGAKSQLPVYFGQYSKWLFLLVAGNAAIIIGSVIFIWTREFFLGQACLFGFCLMSFAVVGNTHVSNLPLIEGVLPLIRVFSAAAICVLSFIRLRYERRSGTTMFFAFAVVLLLVGVSDAFVYGVLQSKAAEERRFGEGFRDHYALDSIEKEDSILVGDSFVWGAGVTKSERFCERAQIHWQSIGDTKKVYCLGKVGVNLKGYLKILKSLPSGVEAREIFVVFYHNDFPPRDIVWERLARVLESLSRSSKGFLLIRDLFLRLVRLDAHEYQRFLVGNYNKAELDFALRWRLFEEQVAEIYREAQRIAPDNVYFVILPLAMNFESYPLAKVDEEITQAATAIGYKVLNPIAFLVNDGISNGEPYRAAANDNHYNAALNDAIGRYLVFGRR